MSMNMIRKKCFFLVVFAKSGIIMIGKKWDYYGVKPCLI